MATENLKIVKLQIENVKRIKAFLLNPDGESVVLGGDNGAGKSSVLDAILYAMGGRGVICEEPLRTGESHGFVEAEIGKYLVTRTFTKGGGGMLSVSDRETGAKFPSPQALLDKLVGDLTFDPMSFERRDPKEQSDILKRLAGIDLTDLDGRHAELFEKRTVFGRMQKMLVGNAEGLPGEEGGPTDPVDTDRLMGTLREAERLNAAQSILESKVSSCQEAERRQVDRMEEMRGRISSVEEELASLKKTLVFAEENLRLYGEQTAAALKNQTKFLPVNTEDLMEQMKAAKEENERRRQNAAKKEALDKARKATSEYHQLTAEIEKVRESRERAITQAKMPLAGLGLSDTSVTFRGLPFNQLSSAERLRVSIAISMAMNPQLRIIMVRDGSLLDDKNFSIIMEAARSSGYQVWMEVVGKNERATVVIVDGEAHKNG